MGVAVTRVRTFLIADVRGYTAFTQARGDEAAGLLAGVFAGIVREAVEARGGVVVELRGDEALAVFDSAREAVRAAVELQQTFEHEVLLDSSLPLVVGIGLDAGEAVELEGGFRGGALNLAARLCSRAGPGEVLASRGVVHLARVVDGVVFEDRGSVEVKGIDEPVPIVLARASTADALALPWPRPVGVRGDVPPELDPVMPIVGRDREVRRLRWAWRRARRGKGGVVVVCGPSGIGKTRLAAAGAEVPAGDGALMAYRSFAEGRDVAVPSLDGAAAAYVVLDDLESGSSEQVAKALGWIDELGAVPSLVVVAFDDERAGADLVAAARRLAGDAGVLRPAPLGVDDIRRIAAIYLGDAVDALPAGLLESSGGVPSRVHEQVGGWAHAEASRRLGAAASEAAAGRSDLRSVERRLASSVVDLQLVREQARLFGARQGVAGDVRAPYRGLAGFETIDAEWFFGRERLVAELVARLAGATLLGVVGSSGSGKSSAVKAGLVPALAVGVLPGSEGWTVVVMRPGEHPLRELDRTVWGALGSELRTRLEGIEFPLRAARDVLAPAERLVVVVDQFEEVFTACRDESERRAFIAALTEAARDPRGTEVVVLAVRADYYGRCAIDPDLAELLGANHVLVGPMSAGEYRRAIEQPALRAGARVEPALVEELVGEVVGEPGALPLLSTALSELWEQRDGRTLRLSGHAATAGVRGAVARLAEAAYAALDDHQKPLARAVLLRLAGPGEGPTVVRRRVSLSEFDVDRNDAVAGVLSLLTARRLLTVSDGSVEVAHEALLREWPRFQDWLEQDREGRRLHAHLTESAREWHGHGHEPGELYRGARLAAAFDWTTQHTLELNELEREFIAASRSQSQRSVRRLRTLLVALAALLVLAVVGVAVALVQRQSARHEATVALARQLGAEAVIEPRIDRAMLLAREAVNLERSPQTEGGLLSTLLRSPAAIATFTVPITVRPLSLALSPDGRTLVVNDNQGEVRLYDTRTHTERGRAFKGVGANGAPFVYTPSGRLAVTFTDNRPDLALVDLQRSRIVRLLPMDHRFATMQTSIADPLLVTPDGHTALMTYAAIQPDGITEGAAFVDRWDLATGKLVSVTQLHGATGILAAQLVNHGRDLLTLNTGQATTWALPTLRLVNVIHFHLPGAGAPVAAISADGHTAAVPTDTGSVDFIDLATRHVTQTTQGHTAPIENLGFSPDGHHLVTIGDDRRVVIWQTGNPQPLETLTGHASRVIGLAFSSDSQTLFTSSLDGAIFEWDLAGGRGFGQSFHYAPALTGRGPTAPPPLAVAPTSSSFATAHGSQVQIWSIDSPKLTGRFAVTHAPGATINALAWSPKQAELAVAWTVPGQQGPQLASGHVEVWRLSGRATRVMSLHGLTGTINDVAWSPDGQTVAAITGDQTGPTSSAGTLARWTVATGHLQGAPLHRSIDGHQLAFSSDGTMLATTWGDNRVLLLSAHSARLLRTLPNEGGTGTVAFAPNGELATGSYAGVVQLWNSSTGAQIGRATQVTPLPVASISFDPSGDTFATSGGSDGIPKLWTTATLQQLGSDFPGDPGAWLNTAYTPNGDHIVVISANGRGWIWPATPTTWENHACQVASRNLTQEEWARFVTGHPYTTVCPQFPPGE